MNRQARHVNAIIAFFGILLFASNEAWAEEPANPWPRDSSPGLTALASASEQGQYAFVVFWKQDNEQTQRMYSIVQSTLMNMPTTAVTVSVCVADQREGATVEQFGVDRAPLPLVAAVAPNGAVTKAWPLQVRAEQLREGIVSDGTARCMKALQDQKLVLLCVQNSKTAHNTAAWQGAQGFATDARFATSSEVVTLDPADSREVGFLKTLQVNPQTSEAVTVLLTPPGRPVAQFVGAVSTEEIVAKVTSAKAGCCPGGQCGPGGCCPGGKCGPAK